MAHALGKIRHGLEPLQAFVKSLAVVALQLQQACAFKTAQLGVRSDRDVPHDWLSILAQGDVRPVLYILLAIEASGAVISFWVAKNLGGLSPAAQ